MGYIKVNPCFDGCRRTGVNDLSRILDGEAFFTVWVIFYCIFSIVHQSTYISHVIIIYLSYFICIILSILYMITGVDIYIQEIFKISSATLICYSSHFKKFVNIKIIFKMVQWVFEAAFWTIMYVVGLYFSWKIFTVFSIVFKEFEKFFFDKKHWKNKMEFSKICEGDIFWIFYGDSDEGRGVGRRSEGKRIVGWNSYYLNFL